MDVTKAIANYINDKGISLKRVSEATGIPYNPICSSLGADGTRKPRKLRGDELLKVCNFLEVNPMRFMDLPKADKPA